MKADILLASLVAVLLSVHPASAQKVIGVRDGQTVVLSGDHVKRLWAMRAPVGDEPFATESKQALERMVASGVTEVVVEDDGSVVIYGLAAQPKGASLNFQMIKEGWARHTFPSSDPFWMSFSRIQQEAAKSRRGIWGSPTASRAEQARFTAERSAAIAALNSAPVERSQQVSQPSTTLGQTLPEAVYASADGTISATVQARITETNESWSRFSWRVTVRNKGSSSSAVVVTVEFQDADGFPVATSGPETITISAGAEETATGFNLIRAEPARNVRKIAGKIGAPR
jgi:endonuclease YncB( thermonuclease family)